MKKIALLMVMSFSMAAHAQYQYDTLTEGVREPTYYYWDTNWYDSYIPRLHALYPNLWFGPNLLNDINFPTIIARPCITDTALRIIGVAAPVYFRTIAPTFAETNDTTIAGRLPEYFYLYKPIDSNMLLLDSVQWGTIHPRYVYYEPNEHFICPIYEAYFDNPITVTDSFYVGASCFNNFQVKSKLPSSDEWAYAHVTTQYVGFSPGGLFPEVLPHPHHIREIYIDSAPQQLWDNYHTIHNIELNKWKTYFLKDFIAIFPIIDTSDGGTTNPTCLKPDRLHVMSADRDLTVLGWHNTSSNVSNWEVSIADSSTDPDNGTITQHNTNMASFTLDTMRHYVAYVRAVCNNGLVSDWSDSLHIYIPGDTSTTSTEGIDNIVGQYTYIVPNPTKGLITVASSFRIKNIEIYNALGQREEVIDVNNIGITLDLSKYPAGTYFIRIDTPRGDTFKKVIKD